MRTGTALNPALFYTLISTSDSDVTLDDRERSPSESPSKAAVNGKNAVKRSSPRRAGGKDYKKLADPFAEMDGGDEGGDEKLFDKEATSSEDSTDSDREFGDKKASGDSEVKEQVEMEVV